MLAKLRHPFILRYYTSFVEDDMFVIVTEYCEGGDLRKLLKELKAEGNHLTEDHIGQWLVQLLMATSHIHECKVMHRDLKLSNLFIKNGQLKIGDFGISRLINSTMDMATTFVGTPYYMSPEVLQQEAYNSKSDIWSLGIIVYEICTQKHAYTGTNLIRVLWQAVEGPCPKLPSGFGDELQSLLNAMLVKDPESRPSAASLLRFPLIQQHMLNMFKNVILSRAEDSTNELEDKLNEIQAIWRFPNNLIRDTDDSIGTRSRLNSNPSLHSGRTLATIETTESEIDVSKLTPRERIRLCKHTEEDLEVAQLREAAEQYTRDRGRNMSQTKESNQETFQTDPEFLRTQSSLQQPEETLLRQLHEFCTKLDGTFEEGKDGLDNDADELAVDHVKESEDSDEDLFWPYPSAIQIDPFQETLKSKDMQVEHKEETTPEVLEQTSSLLDIKQAIQNIPISTTDGEDTTTEKPIVEPYWQLYTDLSIPSVPVEEIQTVEDFKPIKTKVKDLEQSEEPLFVRRYLNATAPIDKDLEFNMRTLHDLEHGAITFREGAPIDTLITEPYVSSYVQETAEIDPQAEIKPVIDDGDEDDPDELLDDDASQMPSEGESTVGDSANRSILSAQSTMTQLVECMRTALRVDPDTEQTITDRTLESVRSTQDLRQAKIDKLRNHCKTQMSERAFNEAYAYLLSKRIQERNMANELDILAGLRVICPDVTLGFMLDQLLFLEHGSSLPLSQPRNRASLRPITMALVPQSNALERMLAQS